MKHTTKTNGHFALISTVRAFGKTPLHVTFTVAFALIGCSGDDGADGINGAQGKQGARGTDGMSCTIQTADDSRGDFAIYCGEEFVGYLNHGEQGLQGASGQDGAKGDTGERGEQGLQGDKGDTGAKGDTGERGEQGLQGDKGDTGERGEQGLQGDKGDTGERGEQGLQGEQGIQGEQGEKGDNGQNGTSCTVEMSEDLDHDYEILCSGVFVGYLDNGKNGEQGLQGDKGDDGEDGEQGIPGVSCDVAEDGAYFVMSCGGVEKARWAKAWCGATAYDPQKLLCEGGSVVITDTRDDKVYKVMTIGDQTWMIEDLNYNSATTYNWATAMDFESKCNDESCSVQTQTPHKGICPAGWHLPNNADWRTLQRNFTTEFATSGEWWSTTEYDVPFGYPAYLVYFWDVSDGSLRGDNSFTNKTLTYGVRCVRD